MVEMDGLKRFEFECPSCKTDLAEWTERCPKCGQDLLEVYSGTFRAGRGPATRLAAGVILLAILAGAVGAIFMLWCR